MNYYRKTTTSLTKNQMLTSLRLTFPSWEEIYWTYNNNQMMEYYGWCVNFEGVFIEDMYLSKSDKGGTLHCTNKEVVITINDFDNHLK